MDNKKLKIEFATRITPNQARDHQGRVPLIEEVKIGQDFFRVEASRTTSG